MPAKDINYYMSLPYCIVIAEDKTEGGFTAFIPELAGCATCAESFDEIHDLMEDAKRVWIESELEAGHDIPEPSGNLHASVPILLGKSVS